MRIRVVALGLLVMGLSVPSNAQEKCQGDTFQEHHVGNFNFATNSRTEDVQGRRRYISCVENMDPGSDLLVHWFIPGPYKQYVPSTRVVTTPRLRDDLHTRPVAGCIQYGGLGEITRAEFLGTEDDEARSNSGDCTSQAAAATFNEVKVEPLGLPQDGYADEVHIYFPSNADRPSETMLELYGKVGFTAKDDAYQSFFSYAVQPLDGRREGNVEDVRVEPYFPGSSEVFMSAFLKANASLQQPLAKEGSLTFDVTGNGFGKWRAVEAYYQFIDRENKIVARVPMPLLQAAGQ